MVKAESSPVTPSLYVNDALYERLVALDRLWKQPGDPPARELAEACERLVDAGVARSRSDALAWCVRLTGEHADAWLAELRDALRRVEEVRSQGPAGSGE